MTDIAYLPAQHATPRHRIGWLGQYAVNLWRKYAGWRSMKRAQAHLRSLDDRMLNDIGISRSMIDAAIRDGNTSPKRTRR